MEQGYNALPHNPDAERGVLGRMMKSQEAVIEAQETLREEDFYDPACREIYSAMLAVSSKSKAINVITVSEELTRRGKLEALGGTPFLVELFRSVPAQSDVKTLVSSIEDHSTLRKLIRAGETIVKDCYAGEKETADLLAEAEKSVYDITMRKGGEALTHIQQVLVDTYTVIERLAKNKGKIEGVPAGYRKLDEATTGFHGGELVLIAARPSMGKTAFGMNIIENAAIRAHKKAAVFSLEMPASQLVLRMFCTEAKVELQKIRSGRLDVEEWTRLGDAMSVIAESEIYIDDTSGLTVPEIRSKARRLQIEKGLDVILIDYLQLISGTGKFGSHQEEVAGISRDLKAMAKELNVPVIALSQLSRANSSRGDHRPVLTDIRDSGAIEQDADVVMFIHREEYYSHKPEDAGKAEILIRKQRNGSLADIDLGFKGEYTWFMDLDPQAKEVE